jgi:hypothetical protein
MLRRRRVVLAVAILVIVVPTSLLFLRAYRDDPILNARSCYGNAARLGAFLRWYASETGAYPRSGQWRQTLEHFCAERSSAHLQEFLRIIKCPSDKSGSVCSYEMNPVMSGKRFSGFSGWPAGHTVILTERCFPGSHKRVVFVDGHVGTSNRP